MLKHTDTSRDKSSLYQHRYLFVIILRANCFYFRSGRNTPSATPPLIANPRKRNGSAAQHEASSRPSISRSDSSRRSRWLRISYRNKMTFEWLLHDAFKWPLDFVKDIHLQAVCEVACEPAVADAYHFNLFPYGDVVIHKKQQRVLRTIVALWRIGELMLLVRCAFTEMFRCKMGWITTSLLFRWQKQLDVTVFKFTQKICSHPTCLNVILSNKSKH